MAMELMSNYECAVYSPGRINLIGEHTDYNEGWVLPTAIDKEIVLYFRRNSQTTHCHIVSLAVKDTFSFDLSQVEKSSIEWHNYILGVVHQIQKAGHVLSGFDVHIESNLPTGSGISSSAALECGMAMGLNTLFQLHIDKEDIVRMAQKAEHTFVGTKCGIMDQYASVMSRHQSFILLDCRSLEASFIPADLEDYNLVLLNTKVSHSLASSAYNTRRAECEEAVAIISQNHPEVRSLRDVTQEMLSNYKKKLDPIIFKRSAYVISENKRVLDAVEALRHKDFKTLGKLMYDSHYGLQHEYQVSCKELDFLVKESRKHKAVLGSRMMGGGFGGCTLSLVTKKDTSQFIDQAYGAYKKEFNIRLDAVVVQTASGTRIKKTNS